MAIVKHIGKHGDQRVAILFREVPEEEWMALVVYPDRLQRNIHDSIMKVLESDQGQQADSLGDVLGRNLLSDGRQILTTLHKEGFIKKVRTSDIIVTPNPQSHVRLDELNKILDGMRDGTDAAEKLADLDANAGLVDPVQKARDAAVVTEAGGDLLDDATLAKDRLEQARQMVADGNALIAEGERLAEEAYELDPALKPRRRGRPSKKVEL